MLKKAAALLLASSLMLGISPIIKADDEKIENNAVSGYVTTAKSDFELVGDTKTPVIHVDEDDYESVVRAVGDLSEDIKSVTDKESQISHENIVLSSHQTEGIEINGGTMTVSLNSPVSTNAVCYVAAYNESGMLSSVVKAREAINPTNDGNTLGFSFDEAVSKPKGGKIKAFVWTENNKPLTDVIGMKSNEAVDLSGTDIVIGTLGISDTIDALAESGAIDVSQIADKWESFTVQSVDNTLVIAGSDKRGTIYGIYDLCEKIGISPWEWWSDVEPVKADALYINLPEGGYTEGEPSVKYRGIFINDEYNLNQWSASIGNGTAMTHETYEKVFELLLRLKANYLWPAMHAYSPAFHNDAENAGIASRYCETISASLTIFRINGKRKIRQRRFTRHLITKAAKLSHITGRIMITMATRLITRNFLKLTGAKA